MPDSDYGLIKKAEYKKIWFCVCVVFCFLRRYCRNSNMAIPAGFQELLTYLDDVLAVRETERPRSLNAHEVMRVL